MIGDISQIISIMDTIHGFDITRFNVPFIDKTLQHRQAATSILTLAEYSEYLKTHPGEAEEFYSYYM